MGRRRAVFVDRDGVLNEPVVRDGKPYPPATVADVVMVCDAPAGVHRLQAAGFLVLCVTNQPDVARGTQCPEIAAAIMDAVAEAAGIDDVFICAHDDMHDCGCRKPRPGLMLLGAKRYGVDLQRSYLVGDRWRDIDAGANAGCRTILIDRQWRERPPAASPDAQVSSLSEAVDWILKDAIK